MTVYVDRELEMGRETWRRLKEKGTVATSRSLLKECVPTFKLKFSPFSHILYRFMRILG